MYMYCICILYINRFIFSAFRLYKLCSNHTTLKEQGLRFVNTIKELLQHLLEYRKIIQSEVKELRMSCIVNLLVSTRLHLKDQWQILEFKKTEGEGGQIEND